MKKLFFNFLFLILVLGACAQAPADRPLVLNPKFDKKISQTISFSVPTISPKELAEKEEDKIYILDAREREEYDVSHIPNAQFIGYDNFDVSTIKNIPKNAPIVVYCSIGYRSEKIGEQLQKNGYSNVSNLYGSIFEWMNQGFPVENNDGETTQKVHTYNKAWSKWVDENKATKVW